MVAGGGMFIPRAFEEEVNCNQCNKMIFLKWFVENLARRSKYALMYVDGMVKYKKKSRIPHSCTDLLKLVYFEIFGFFRNYALYLYLVFVRFLIEIIFLTFISSLLTIAIMLS